MGEKEEEEEEERKQYRVSNSYQAWYVPLSWLLYYVAATEREAHSALYGMDEIIIGLAIEAHT